jgi:protein-tyrosine-phosphatase
VRVARSFGIELGEHRSRPLALGELETTDLVVGFEPFHVATAVVDGAAANGRTFLLTELAEAFDRVALSDDSDVDSLLGLSDGYREEIGTPARAIGDPVGGTDRLTMSTFIEIEDLVARVAFGLMDALADRTG